MVFNSRFVFNREKIRGRGCEEVHHRLIVEQWRIGGVDQHIRAGYGVGEAFTGE